MSLSRPLPTVGDGHTVGLFGRCGDCDLGTGTIVPSGTNPIVCTDLGGVNETLRRALSAVDRGNSGWPECVDRRGESALNLRPLGLQGGNAPLRLAGSLLFGLHHLRGRFVAEALVGKLALDAA